MTNFLSKRSSVFTMNVCHRLHDWLQIQNTPHIICTQYTYYTFAAHKTMYYCYTGPPHPPDQLSLLSLSAYEAQVSWVVVFDGNDPVVMYHIFVWNSDVNVSLCVRVCMHS